MAIDNLVARDVVDGIGKVQIMNYIAAPHLASTGFTERTEDKEKILDLVVILLNKGFDLEVTYEDIKNSTIVTRPVPDGGFEVYVVIDHEELKCGLDFLYSEEAITMLPDHVEEA